MKELEEKIIELREKGFSFKKIKNELNCALSTIQYHCKKHGLNSPNVSLRLEVIGDYNSESEGKILKLRNEKKSYLEIQEETKYSMDLIKKVCRKHNLQKMDTIKIEPTLIIEKYIELKSLRKTALFFETTRDTIRKYVDVNKHKLTEEEKKKLKSQHVISWRKRKKIELINYKGGECECCGYKRCVSALEFHHKDPKEKDFNISGKSYSIERLKKEIDKCILVCSNCHSEIHEGLIKI
jgi:hypothetical protein